MVTLKLGEENRTFLIDSGASISAIQRPAGKLTHETVSVVGATGKSGKQPIFQIDDCTIKGRTFTHKFALLPGCPINLMGHDMLCRLEARLTFTRDGNTILEVPEKEQSETWGEIQAPVYMLWKYSALWHQGTKQVLAIQRKDEEDQTGIMSQVPADVWAENGGYGKAKNHAPILIALKPGCTPVSLPQYHIPQRQKEGLEPILKGFIEEGILVECRSAWNTPLYPVEKRNTGQFRPVHDLRAVNARVEPLAPLVADPYTMLSRLSPTHVWYSTLDIKDAFFTMEIAPASIPIFAFTWEDSQTGLKSQRAWSRLPQGFVHSPTMFAERLEKDLSLMPQTPGIIVLQYVDDVLVAGTTWENCTEATTQVIRHLHQCGYKLSRTKAQLVKKEVEYLGFGLKEGQKIITPARVEAICKTDAPRTRKGVRAFLGMVGYCRLWIPDHASLAQPLYEATKGKETDPFLWTEEQQKAFEALKDALVNGAALGLPDVKKPFSLYVTESRGIAKGVLTQTLLQTQRPCAYLSKKLDSVAAGFPSCLRVVAAAALLLHDAKKITFGAKIVIYTSHAMRPLLMEGGMNWMSTNRAFKYQVRLLEDPSVEIQVCQVLNPATFLPEGEGPIEHDCVQTIQQNWKPRPDLKDQPLKNPDIELFIDGSSFIENGIRRTGYSIVSLDSQEPIEAKSLPASASAQAAELIAMIRSLQLHPQKRINIWSDSKWVCLLIHVHAQLYKEKGMVDSKGKEIKYKKLVEILLKVIMLPKEIAVMHCRGHQKGNTNVIKGNNLADRCAKVAAKLPPAPRWYLRKQAGLWVLTSELNPEAKEFSQQQCEPVTPVLALLPNLEGIEQTWVYETKDKQLAEALGATPKEQWWVLPDNRILIPHADVEGLVKFYHSTSHSGAEAMYDAIKSC